MKFVSVRELRGRSGSVWSRLETDRELVVTSNGKPIAILAAAGEDVEATLRAVRRARGTEALTALQRRSAERGTDRLAPREIEKEIRAVRRKRPR